MIALALFLSACAALATAAVFEPDQQQAAAFAPVFLDIE